MTTEATPATTPFPLLRVRDGLLVDQALYAVAKLGVADLLKDAPQTPRNLRINSKSMNPRYTESCAPCEAEESSKRLLRAPSPITSCLTISARESPAQSGPS